MYTLNFNWFSVTTKNQQRPKLTRKYREINVGIDWQKDFPEIADTISLLRLYYGNSTPMGKEMHDQDALSIYATMPRKTFNLNTISINSLNN